jgi:hypothetical protein
VVDLEGIRARVARNEFEFSRHAVDQTIQRRITVHEVREAIAASEIIEDYPNDKYGPSCLLLGVTAASRPLHIQVSYPCRPVLKVVTLYEPDPDRWINRRIRRPAR